MNDSETTFSNSLYHFFPETLISLNSRSIVKETGNQSIPLDKNELPYEIDKKAKQAIIDELKSKDWNRYPSAYYPELEDLISSYAGVKKENIVIGTGAAQLIEMLFNLFARKELVIAHPSFSLFEFLCKAYGIQYKRWELDKEMNYNLDLLPQIKRHSVVVLASPNNPTGTIIQEELLHNLLNQHQDSLFVVDEVYSEFSDKTLEGLIEKYPNLILIRSFSKAFGLAGARIGHLICPKEITKQLKKIVLPFVLNHFSETALKTIMTNSEILFDIKNKILKVIQDRDEMIEAIRKSSKSTDIKAYNSHANFLLVKFRDEKQFQNAFKSLKNKSIHILNLSHIPSLDCSMRISIGLPDENKKVLECLLNSSKE